VTTAELAGGFAVTGSLPVTGRIEQSFRRRIAPLPAMTRHLLLLAAAEPTGDPALLWRAAGGLSISADAATPAEADGLLTVGAQVTFRHPLVRSAVYQAAPVADRRRAHRAIAEATDPGTDPDRWAWHRAQAAPGPDEDVASELERSASRAQARGGLAAAAAFMERSAALTLEPARRAERALAAAQAKYQAGAFGTALALLAAAEGGSLNELQRARADLLRGHMLPQPVARRPGQQERTRLAIEPMPLPDCSRSPAVGPGCWLGIPLTRTRSSRAESPGMGNPPHTCVSAAVSGEDADAAFRCLYAEHGPALLRLATTLTGGDRGRAEDLVQETMLRAWTHRNNLDMQHRPPRAWLITVARRLAVDAHRARRARPQEVQLEEHLARAGGQRADGGIDEFGVRAAIAALPGPQRQVLAEIYYRDRSVADTARILQIPPGTVRSRTSHGLRSVRRALAARDAVA